MKYLSVADNAGDAVVLHVPASSEKQEGGNKTRIKKGTKRRVVKFFMTMDPFSCIFCKYYQSRAD